MKDNPLLAGAGRFHGHIGPFLAVGLRMGQAANERLGRNPMGMSSVVRVEGHPPRSCAVDGIQYSTGCTMGKANIRMDPEPQGVSATFTVGGRSISITVRSEFLARIEKDLEGAPEKAVVDYAFKIMDTPSEDIFEVAE
jgi:formylmethanofuran dehydrogenase subunit E